MRALPALVLAVALAGCASVFGMCGPMDTAQWTEPGLYAALVRAGATPAMHPYGRPLDAGLAATYGEEARIEGVHYGEPTGGRAGSAMLGASWTSDAWVLAVTLPDDVAEDELRAFARAFLANVSDEPARWEAWEDALAQAWDAPPPSDPNAPRVAPARGIGRGVSIPVEGDFRLAELMRELGVPASRPQGSVPGEVHPSQGPWRFDVRLAVVEHERRVEEGRLKLRVDSMDQVFGYVEHKDASDFEATHAALTREAQRLGIATPRVPATFSTMVC